MVVRKSREEWKIHNGVFDQWTERVLEKLRGQGHFDELAGALAIGKEANCFTTYAEEPTIVKIYRLENREFKTMLQYLLQDPRYMHVKRRKREIVFAWTQREYRNLMLAREVIPVPKPIAQRHNVLVMEQIGDNEPAPQLKDAIVKDVDTFFSLVVQYMKDLKKKGLIHGDLSEFNILVDKDRPIFIDFSQSSPPTSSNAEELWSRDVRNIIRVAKKFDVQLAEEDFA